MAYPCDDCGKVLATQGGLDVHRAQWCRGPAAAPGTPTGTARRGRSRLGRRKRTADLSLVDQPAREEAAGEEPHVDHQWHSDVPAGVAASAPEAPGPAIDLGAAAGGEDGAVGLGPAGGVIDLRGDEEQVELSLVMWLMRRRVQTNRLPPDRTVLRFEFTGSCRTSYWMVLERREATLCVSEPRLVVDVVVTADATTFERVFMGRMLLSDAVSDGLIRIDGPETLVHSLPRWFEWSRPVHARSSPPTS